MDMRWGVRDENISYHQTSDICVQEIHNCQRLSLGPSFIVSDNIMSVKHNAQCMCKLVYNSIMPPKRHYCTVVVYSEYVHSQVDCA